MLEEKYDLPVDWSWKTVADVIEDAQPGFASGAKGVKGGIRHLRMNNCGADCRLNLDSVLTVPRELARPHHILQRSDVLVCHTNSVKLVGKTAIFDIDDGPYAFSNHLTRLRVNPSIIDPRWLWRVMSTLWRERYFENRCKQWVNQATIERETLLSAPVPLPPLPEQQSIVVKIERLLAESRTAREALERVPALLKRFRQAVLAKAFRGELTERDPNDEPASVLLERIREERWRKWEEGKGRKSKKYVEPEPPDTSSLPELPDGWVWVRLPQLAWDASYGTSQKCSYAVTEFPVLRIPNVINGDFNLTDLKYATDRIDESRALTPDDLLIIRTNGSKNLIGRSALVAKAFEKPHFFASYLIRFRVLDIPPVANWVAAIWDAPAIRDWVEQTVSTSAGQYNISIGDLDKLVLPLPPLAEQRRIVAKIESLFAQVDTIERAAEVAQRRTEKVDRAVLARAFRGEL